MGVNSLPSHYSGIIKVCIVLEIKSDDSKEFGMGKMLEVFQQTKCLVVSVFGYLYCACHCGMSLYKHGDALNLLLF